MKLFIRRSFVALFAFALLIAARDLVAQVDDGGVRRLAPGVETTIPLAKEEAETNAVHDIVELVPGTPGLQWKPNTAEITKTLDFRARDVLFRRGIWEFQFTFKPLRMRRVDIPQTNGRMKNELIWYMVFRVTNPGGHLTPIRGEPAQFSGGAYTIAKVNSHTEMMANIGAHRFNPIFLLRTHDSAELAVDGSTIQYADEVIPAARRAIYDRERPPVPYEEFYDTVRIGTDPIPVSSERQQISRWGVVTWRGIDPTVDYVSIQIMGLTNAYKWVDPDGAFKPGDPPGTGRQFVYKTLQMNFYIPGDEFSAREEDIQLGVKGQPEWFWLYRPNPTTLATIRPAG